MHCTRIWRRLLLAPSNARARRCVFAPKSVLLAKSKGRTSATSTLTTTTTTTTRPKKATTYSRTQSGATSTRLSSGTLRQALGHPSAQAWPLHQPPSLLHSSNTGPEEATTMSNIRLTELAEQVPVRGQRH